MVGIMLGLIAMVFVSIYCALILGKKTDQRIARYVTEDDDDSPMMVRFPNEVFRGRTSATHG